MPTGSIGVTQAPTTNNTSLATTAFVAAALASGSTSVTIGVTPPASPSVGALWWDSVGGQGYIWYNDGTSSQWAPFTNQPGPQGPAGPAFTGGTVTSSIAFSPSTLGLTGTATNDNAAAGVVGEVLATAITTAQTMTTNTAMNVGTLSLTAGDWDVDGMVQVTPSAAPTVIGCAINTASATMPAAGNTAAPMQRLTLTFTSAAVQIMQTGRMRVSLAATTNVYLIAIATFASGTCSSQGYISARRRR
jgi:hypothetical protein